MIKVLYFARLGELFDTREETFSATGISTIEQLVTQLKARGGRWQDEFDNGRVLVSINQEIAGFSDSINDGDEVAFFPPVTGG